MKLGGLLVLGVLGFGLVLGAGALMDEIGNQDSVVMLSPAQGPVVYQSQSDCWEDIPQQHWDEYCGQMYVGGEYYYGYGGIYPSTVRYNTVYIMGRDRRPVVYNLNSSNALVRSAHQTLPKTLIIPRKGDKTANTMKFRTRIERTESAIKIQKESIRQNRNVTRSTGSGFGSSKLKTGGSSGTTKSRPSSSGSRSSFGSSRSSGSRRR